MNTTTTALLRGVSRSINATCTKSMNMNAATKSVRLMSSQTVRVDTYTAPTAAPTPTPMNSSASASVDTDFARLPNNDRERNAMYENEESRSMSNIEASVRHDWTKDQISQIYNLPFHELMYQASTVHRMYWNAAEVQQCTLLSIKTGGCTEDCSYCSQSTRHKTFVKPEPTMKVNAVLEAAKRAKEAGSTRFCMGAAWRELGNKKNAFGHILEMVKGVNGMGLEVCCTLGMLDAQQAKCTLLCSH